MNRLVLPYPVSANRYWISFYAPKLKRVCVGPTGEAKAYRDECGWIAKAAGFRKPWTGDIEIGAITLVPPAFRMSRHPTTGIPREVKNGVVINLDNCLKVMFDALNEIVYVDDAQIKRIRGPIEYGAPDGKGALIIEVTEIQPQQSPIPLPEPELAQEPF